MQIKHFIGIDVSKDTLDLSVVINGKKLHYCRIKNTTKDIRSTITRIIHSLNGSFDDTIFCMEHTGIYNLPLVKWLHSNGGGGLNLGFTFVGPLALCEGKMIRSTVPG